MKVIPWNKDISGTSIEINTKGIESIKKRYLKRVGEFSIEGLFLPKANRLFLLVIGDFKKGILSSDDLASFGFAIFHGVAKHYPNSDLFQASLSASELSFCIRTKETYKDLPRYLVDIDNFYKNKS